MHTSTCCFLSFWTCAFCFPQILFHALAYTMQTTKRCWGLSSLRDTFLHFVFLAPLDCEISQSRFSISAWRSSNEDHRQPSPEQKGPVSSRWERRRTGAMSCSYSYESLRNTARLTACRAGFMSDCYGELSRAEQLARTPAGCLLFRENLRPNQETLKDCISNLDLEFHYILLFLVISGYRTKLISNQRYAN